MLWRYSTEVSTNMVVSEGSLLNKACYALNKGILLVLFRMKPCLHVHAEESSECLPESCPERAEKCLDNIERTLVRLAVYQFQQHLALIAGHGLHHGLVLLENVMLKGLEMLFTLFLIRDGLDIFIRLAESREGEFRIGEGTTYVAHGSPIELFLLLILEFQGRVDVHVANKRQSACIAIFIHDMRVALVCLDLESQFSLVLLSDGVKRK